MSSINFSSLNTLAVFKDFLQQYHAQLVNEKNFPPLGIQKSLHLAAPIFGFKNWHAMSASLDYSYNENDFDIIMTTITTLDNDLSVKDKSSFVSRGLKQVENSLRNILDEMLFNLDCPLAQIMECKEIIKPDNLFIKNSLGGDNEIIEWILGNNQLDNLVNLIRCINYDLIEVSFKKFDI